jgi:hypothetical protein
MIPAPKGKTCALDMTLSMSTSIILADLRALKLFAKHFLEQAGVEEPSFSSQFHRGPAYTIGAFFDEGQFILRTWPPKLLISITITTASPTVNVVDAFLFAKKALEPQRVHEPIPIRRCENAT